MHQIDRTQNLDPGSIESHEKKKMSNDFQAVEMHQRLNSERNREKFQP